VIRIILFFSPSPFLIGIIIITIGAIIDTIRKHNNKGNVYQIYYQSKESQWVALPFFYNYEYFQAKKGLLSELQATFPELNVVMEKAQAPSIPTIQNPVLDSRHQFFHDFIRIFHVSIRCVTEVDEQVPSYTQKEIESLILNYAKKYNVSSVVLNNIDPTYVTYYNELNSVLGWFQWFFLIVIILFYFLFLSFILRAGIYHQHHAAGIGNIRTTTGNALSHQAARRIIDAINIGTTAHRITAPAG
jgi:hypothetical protein